jgi:two-component system, cell cycle sensor histidine kinase and response regulator CckA
MGSLSPNSDRPKGAAPRRSLRRTTLLSILVTVVLLVAGIFGVACAVILNNFEKLERAEAEQNLDRAIDALDTSVLGLSRVTSDYSSWDQSYNFVRQGNPEFTKSEFPDVALANLKLNFVAIVDPSNHLLFTKGYDLENMRVVAFPADLAKRLQTPSRFSHFTNPEGRAAGIIALEYGPALVVSQPILTSDNRGPVEGAVVMGRWLDAQEIDSIGATAHLDLDFVPLHSSDVSSRDTAALLRLSSAFPRLVAPADTRTIIAYHLLNDVDGKPAGVLRMRMPRNMYQQARVSLLQFFVLLLASAAAFTAITLFVIERLVLSRVANLSKNVAALGERGDLAARVDIGGNDELTDLSSSINQMLDALEKSQQKTAEQSARLRIMVERMPAVLWTTDADLRFVISMGAGLKELGHQTDEVSGLSLYEYFGTRDPEYAPIAAHLRALQGESTSYVTTWMSRTFESHTEPLRDANDAIVGVIGIALDSTGRVQAEEALRESESGYRSIIQEAPYGICRCTVGGSFTLVNRALVRMLAFDSANDLLGLNIGTDIFEESRDHSNFIEQLHFQNNVEGVETLWKQHGGKSIIVRLAGRAVRDAHGQIAYFEVIAEDISERRQLELQLRQSQKMQAIGQLAGGVAHDFNNLLTVVKGHIELILNTMQLSDPLFPRLDQVQKAANRASSLTRQLLAFSRQQVLQPQILDLNGIVSGMIQMLSRIIGENIELVFRPGGILGRVKADAGQLEQTLLNLVVNARDAMPNGGQLTIETENVELDESYSQLHSIAKPGAYVMLAVSDTGCGMDASTQARIFEPFFTTKEPGKGTGLGLATVYGVVKQSDGYIWVYSEPGQGTTFKIYLPLAADVVETPKAQAATPAPVRGSETILLVEDEESVRNLVADFLKTTGHTVLEACDGEEAIRLASAQTHKIDLLISDVVMPKLSGRELWNGLRKRLPTLKVLFISGYTDDSVVRHGVIDGDVAFLQKPFTMRSLAAKIREVLDADEVKEYSAHTRDGSRD